MKSSKILRPDGKGRICLGKEICKNISGYKVQFDEETKEIKLIPYTEIPLQEKWLFSNKKAFESVTRGVEQSLNENLKYLGSFSEYIDKD